MLPELSTVISAPAGIFLSRVLRTLCRSRRFTLSSVTVLKNNVAAMNGSSQIIDSLGGNRSGANGLLSLMQAAIGANANIRIKYSNAGTAATAANSEAFRKLDLLA